MRKEGFYIIYDADDEEPDCFKCDNVTNDRTYNIHGEELSFCNAYCGAKHFWFGYRRTEEKGRRV